MRRVLFIAYQFPPSTEMGGGIRSKKFVEFLGAHDWEVTVVTLDEGLGNKNIECKQEVVQVKSLTPFKRPFNLVPYGWAYNVLKVIKKLLITEKFDLIYVSCPPFPQALSAAYLKRKFRIPLVVDFRDAWSINPHQSEGKINRVYGASIIPLLEKKVIDSCNRLILNTPSVYAAYKKKYPQALHKMLFIPNGYDERDFQGIKLRVKKNKCMRMLYCGSFSSSGRDPEILFEAIKKALDLELKVELVLVGKQSETIYNAVSRLKLNSNVIFMGQVAHSKSIREMQVADVLVNFQSPSFSKVQAISGKTYEYLRSGGAILSIAPLGDNQNIIEQFAKRYELVSDFNETKVLQAIKNLYADWLDDNYVNDQKVNEEFMRGYERKNLTSRLAALFNEVIKKDEI
jgi:glycosyltransferase involved in cell wall biosynthesis